jgi:hypothetical protein
MDCKVLLQLDHIQWKYNRLREVYYKAAQEAADGSVVSAKDLGKMFDKIDASLEKDREELLQNIEKIRKENERKENNQIPRNKDA